MTPKQFDYAAYRAGQELAEQRRQRTRMRQKLRGRRSTAEQDAFNDARQKVSARVIERAKKGNAACRMLAANEHPGHRRRVAR